MATNRKVCFTGPIRLKIAEDLLRGAGCELVLGKSSDDFRDYRYERRELIDLVGDSAVIFPAGRDFIGGDIMDSCPDLQAVVKSSIGIETVDVDAATDEPARAPPTTALRSRSRAASPHANAPFKFSAPSP